MERLGIGGGPEYGICVMLTELLGGMTGEFPPPLVDVVLEAFRLRFREEVDEDFFLSGEPTPLVMSNGDWGGVSPGEVSCVPPPPPSDSGSGRVVRLGFLCCLLRAMIVPKAP